MRFRRSRKENESHLAVEEAERHVQEAKSRTPEVAEVTAALRELRSKNHFADQIAMLMVRDMRRGHG